MLMAALLAMLVQQTLSYMCVLVLPVVAPEAAAELGVSTALIGAYSLFLYAAGLLSAASCGSFIRRYGPLRVSQYALCMLAIGLFLASPGILWLFPVSAVILGLGSGVSTPASSEILARYAPPRHAPLVFSIKQTGVPLGGMLAGLLVPLFAALLGWRGAFWAAGLMCAALAMGLQPLRARFDAGRDPGHPLGGADVFRTLKQVLAEQQLRELAIAAFAFVGVQALFGAFFVTYLVEGLGYGLVEAGGIFAGSQSVAIVARIFWGWLAGRLNIARPTLAALGVAMALACACMASIQVGWSTTVILGIGMLYSGTALSWHGVLLSEIARRSPPGQVGQFTGGVLAFGNAAMMAYPAVYGLLLGLGVGYGVGFLLAGIPALIAGALFLLPLRSGGPGRLATGN
tara:strand:+ start:2181 stop:3383 length:1203 start_codon:yes stop_codon:yes gene_type:complete